MHLSGQVMSVITTMPSNCEAGPAPDTCATSGTLTLENAVSVPLLPTISSSIPSVNIRLSGQQAVPTTSTSSVGDASFTSNTTFNIGSTSISYLSPPYTTTSITGSQNVTPTRTWTPGHISSPEVSISPQPSILLLSTLSGSSGNAISVETSSSLLSQMNSVQSLSPASTSSASASIVIKTTTVVIHNATQSTEGATASQDHSAQTSSYSSMIIATSTGLNLGIPVLPTESRMSDQQYLLPTSNHAMSSPTTQAIPDSYNTFILEHGHGHLNISVMHDVDVANTNVDVSTTTSLPSPFSLIPSEPFTSAISIPAPISVDLTHASAEQSSAIAPTSVSTSLFTVTVSAATQTISINSSSTNTTASDDSTGKRSVRDWNSSFKVR